MKNYYTYAVRFKIKIKRIFNRNKKVIIVLWIKKYLFRKDLNRLLSP